VPTDLQRVVDRALLELAVQAAGVGTFDLDVATDRLLWNDEMYALFGVDRADFGERLGDAYDRIHPDDLPGVTADVAAVSAGGAYASQYRVRLPGGGIRWISARGRMLTDEAGRPVRLVGAAHDVTAQHERVERIHSVVDSLAVGYAALGQDWHVDYVNAEAVRILGRPAGQLVGGVLWDIFPATVGTVFETSFRHTMATGEKVSFDAWYPEPLDAWFEVRVVAEADGVGLYFLDITDRKRAAGLAEQAAQRSALLATVTEQLTGTTEAEEAVGRLARLVVPALGDWCLVSLPDDDTTTGDRRGLRDVGWWHADPTRRALLDEYALSRLGVLSEEAPLIQALRAGQQRITEQNATAVIQAVLQPGSPAHRLIAELAPESFAVFPLRGRGRTVGLLTVMSSADRPPISAEDVVLAQEVAGRAGLALDSARSYRQQRALAEGLQRSMFTTPPQPDHGQIVVRYLPAAEAAQVGGDWYDAFLQPGGATNLVIGDVVGHDVDAAAAMGQLRSMLRGIGAIGDAGPADLLRQLDGALAQLMLPTYATAAIARLEQDEEMVERGITRVRWSNAGHPPPLVIHPDGELAELASWHGELMLGVDPGHRRTESVVVLDRGATVLLFTDGLIERRGSDLDEGMHRLRTAAAELAHLPLDDLCDQLIDRLVEGHPEDDVALVAIRLHPQDQPRPAEAGPQRVPGTVPHDPADD